MHQGLFVTEVVGLLRLKVIDKQLQIVGEVVRDLVLARLPNLANGPDHLLVSALDVPRIGVVDLEADVLDRVLRPQLEFVLRDQHQGQGQLEEDRLDVLLAQFPHLRLA